MKRDARIHGTGPPAHDAQDEPEQRERNQITSRRRADVGETEDDSCHDRRQERPHIAAANQYPPPSERAEEEPAEKELLTDRLLTVWRKPS